MTTISIREAQANLSDLIHTLPPGEKVVITENGRPVAEISVTVAQPATPPRRLGTMAGTVLYMAPDFNAPLDDFKEYIFPRP